MSPKSDNFVHLDMLRGLAALAVVIGHIRGFVLVDFGVVEAPGLLTKVLYFLAGLGHQAVIAFFALSGFLVGGRALQAMCVGRWSLASYTAARLSRLWTVAIPALLLTFALDLLGTELGGEKGYAGGYHDLLSSGPQAGEPADHALLTLIANIAFLQTIAAPVYGSNGPLWSLAYEFWYYVIGALLAAAVLVKAPLMVRLSQGALVLALVAVLPTYIVLLGSVWIAGAFSYIALLSPVLRSAAAGWAYQAVVTALVLSIVLLGYRQSGIVWEIGLGLAWAALLPALAALPSPGGLYARLAHALSEISYTIYATHFPILAFAFFVLIAPRQYQPQLEGLALVAILLVLCLASSALLWWCFERNTPIVRRAMLTLFGGRASRATQEHKPLIHSARE